MRKLKLELQRECDAIRYFQVLQSASAMFLIRGKIRILLADGCGFCGAAALECGGFDTALIFRRL